MLQEIKSLLLHRKFLLMLSLITLCLTLFGSLDLLCFQSHEIKIIIALKKFLKPVRMSSLVSFLLEYFIGYFQFLSIQSWK